jgi:hypothetical protein
MSSLNRLPTDDKVKPRAVYWTNAQLIWLKYRAIEDGTTVNRLIRNATLRQYPDMPKG